MKLTFLSDNKTENAACIAEWGLSLLIESCGHKVLFDVGGSDIFASNAKALGIELDDVESVSVSHGHYDHTEGMETFCRINSTAPIYIHKDGLTKAYGTDEEGNIESENCGIRWTKAFIESIKNRMVLTDGIKKINDNMTLFSNIEPLEEFPMTEKFHKPVEGCDGEYEDDTMSHEQVLVVKENEGIHIFSGCSHTGIMAIIKRAQELFPGEKIISLVAGMHLYPLSKEQKSKVVESISELGIEYLFPVHCTGMEAILMFKQRLGDACIMASAGETYEC